MTKELEAINWLKTKCYVESPQDETFDECLDVIEKALLELQAIKEAKPSEALKSLNKLAKQIELDEDADFWEIKNAYKTVEQALLKQLSGSQYTNIFIDEAVKLSNEEIEGCLHNLETGNFIKCDVCDANWHKGCMCCIEYLKNSEELNTIKQYILKAQKLEKAWEIVKKKGVNVGEFKKDLDWDKFDYSFYLCYSKHFSLKELTQAEFDLLKEMTK